MTIDSGRSSFALGGSACDRSALGSFTRGSGTIASGNKSFGKRGQPVGQGRSTIKSWTQACDGGL
ncbi:hypothetical protein H6F46_18700 [Limnothrix sp. FACHB-1083]|uniref:hypothetical protein n=1 Tax=unclassified Limnothrix TaxID=2632864 RepID=UPI00168144D1|nr:MULTISPECIES: hypothetical protein [unclassified Limnothrix]MBD2162719.1 hypothetical protein [Limnothrix sp. FACHB-1083]MBD2193791.1 hypothetical protein [Limnothrix sp. FACHB-1088]